MPLNPEIHGFLENLREKNPKADWVCLNCEFHHWSLGTKWSRELFRAACIERNYATLHRLRRTFGTRLLLAGADIETVRDPMRHANV